MKDHIYSSVFNSPWLDVESFRVLRLRINMKPHVIIERIWLNVASSYSLNWKIVAKATENETIPYIARVLTNLLTMSALRTFAKMKEADIYVLLGDENQSILKEYYDYIT